MPINLELIVTEMDKITQLLPFSIYPMDISLNCSKKDKTKHSSCHH